jgi:acylpyruvate hydrolase
MKLATIRTDEGTRAVRVDGDTLVDLDAPDLGAFLARPDWRDVAATAAGPTYRATDVTFAPVVPRPSKVVCVGLNYRNHIEEMGRPVPEFPTLFPKWADCLIGATDDIVRPDETEEFDWECELTLVIGQTVRRASEQEAINAIAGFTALNDVSCRDWQFRSREWTQGKNWDSTTPVGPVLVTPDELPGGVRPALRIATTLDGEVMQEDNTGDLLFDPVDLVRYVSTMIRLNPGDMIATGTPGGVGAGREPKLFMVPGQRVTVEIEGIGRLDNLIVAG